MIRNVFGATPARGVRRGLLAAVLALAAGCTTPAPQQAATAPPETSVALPLDRAVAELATAIVTHAQLPPPGPSGKYPIVIDPWIDRATGAQIVTTRLMRSEILALAPQHFPMLELLPFEGASLERRPLVLLGAITGVTAPGSTAPASGPPAAYRIYGVLADLASGRVVANESAWVLPETVDTTPTPFFRDSPAWRLESSTAAYLRTVAARPGDPIDPAYRDGLMAQALIADATTAYDEQRYPRALELYQAATALPGAGDQLRIHNGLYLANQALGQEAAAEAAFARIVDYSLAHDRLAVKFLFRPGSTTFAADQGVSGLYPMWLRQIARRTAGRGSCLLVTGHASPSGAPALNDRLSLARAQRIVRLLEADSPALRGRLAARGAGSRETIIGTGRDDAGDALDRRVEFAPRGCARS